MGAPRFWKFIWSFTSEISERGLQRGKVGVKCWSAFFVDGLPTTYSDPSSPAFDGHLSTTCESVGDGEERVA